MIFSFDKIELLDGVFRFSIEFILIDLLLLGHFFYDWYRNWKATGIKLDYWHVFCVQSIVIPILLFYPLSASYINYISTGQDILYLASYVDDAFFISICGYITMLVGRWFADHARGSCTGRCVADFFYQNFQSGIFYRVIALCAVLASAFMCMLTYSYPDYIFNLREIYFWVPQWRPVLNFIMAILSHGIPFFMLYFLLHHNKSSLLFVGFFMATALLQGNRGPMLLPLLLVGILYAYFHSSKIRLRYIFLSVVFLLVSGIALTALRTGRLEGGEVSVATIFFSELLFGNTFSDLRDFAWVLSGFDDQFLLGKTYLSGLLAFLPSDLLDFRKLYGLGVMTNHFAGITFEHFGLRTGIFGESYLNFGFFGVIVCGMVLGGFLQALNRELEQCVATRKDMLYAYSELLTFSVVATFITTSSGMFIIYSIFAVHILSRILRCFTIKSQ